MFFDFVALVDAQATAEYFVTVGSDGDIRIWNFNQKHMGFALNVDVDKAKMEKYEDGTLSRLCAGCAAQEWRN